MKYAHCILLLIFFIAYAFLAKAQPGTTLITGTVAEKTSIELTIYKTVNKKTEALAEYKVTVPSSEFAFAIPVQKNTTYKLAINVMKQGHRRLEVDRRFSVPLQLKPGQNISVKIIPSLLDTTKNKGLEIKNSTNYRAISFVSGNLVNSNLGNQISLQKVEEGSLVTFTSFNTSKTNKRFQIAIPVKEEGFYYVSSPRFRCRIYLKPADEVELNINAFTGEYDIINGSEENQLVGKWQKLSLPITEYGYNRTIFQNDSLDLEKYISTYEKLQPAIKDFKVGSKTSNEHFNKLLEQAIDVDNEYAPLYLQSCLSVKKNNKFVSSSKTISEPPAFYRQFIQSGKFSDAEILEIGEGMNYINLYQKLNFAFMAEAERKKLWREDRMKIMMDVISNDTVKAYFLKEQMEINEVNNLSEFRAIHQPFEKYTFPTSVKKKYHEVYGGFIGDTTFIGKSSYDFSLPDTSDRMVSMKDFKGKVIFIDVWATWCGPCRGQFPYLKQIEEEYHDNKNIVFIGISTDKLKDKQKWLKTIQKENLGGVQLLDDFGKAFGRKYQIMSIPRFLLIDKQGKWIEIRCPLPEAKEELKRYLDKALEENPITLNR
ncbi:MAG TPA: TlpA disulfide reductase family protein [Chitinophagaceae bacterium]|nr:TlpA disulfide reductase family protein [Chitinophagaceae bacterium]